MATGYMTLPLPITGNTLWADTYNDGGPLSPGSFTRATPGMYWAILWVRTFQIIDRHGHDGIAGQGGKTLDWYYASGYGGRGKWGSNLNLMYKIEGAVIQGNENVHGIYSSYQYSSASIKGIQLIPYYNLPHEHNRALYFSNQIYGQFPMREDSVPENLNDVFKNRYSLYSMMMYNFEGSTSGTAGIDPTNYNAFPSITLNWNTGGSGKGAAVEIINNSPGGCRPGSYEFAGFPNSATDTEMFYTPNTNQPFFGILDSGIEGTAFTWVSTTQHAELYGSLNGFGWYGTYYSGTGAGSLTIYDSPEVKGVSKFDPTTGFNDSDVFFSDDSYDNYGRPFRLGKFFWFSDLANNAGTNFQDILVGNNIPSTEEIILRWYDSSTATMKSYSSDSTGPDTLQLSSNMESILVVKADYDLWFAYFK